MIISCCNETISRGTWYFLFLYTTAEDDDNTVRIHFQIHCSASLVHVPFFRRFRCLMVFQKGGFFPITITSIFPLVLLKILAHIHMKLYAYKILLILHVEKHSYLFLARILAVCYSMILFATFTLTAPLETCWSLQFTICRHQKLALVFSFAESNFFVVKTMSFR